MAWTSLQNSLGNLPQVLAGPILRKVRPESVTVWVATRTAATVELYVMNGASRAAEGVGKTVAIGKNLHIVAVTARPLSSSENLTEGVVYQYDLKFRFDNNLNPMTLEEATNHAPLDYASMTLPSFALPPQDLNQLRLLHGSCRMPHAEGKDTMPLIDDLVADTVNDAYARPHQLLLTGDQIYADDVADSLLLVLSDAAHVLMGWDETLPVSASIIDPVTKLPVAALRKDELSKTGFTSVDLRSHLMSLGEYLCMYLFVWSGVMCASELPHYGYLVDKIRLVTGGLGKIPTMRSFETARERVAEFAFNLWKVRRALANIPTYMIFDDHDVTDDWNGTLDICRKLYGKPLGIRVMQNALTAYALCQHWGNAPEQFESAATAPPGRELLETLDPGLINSSQAIPLDEKAARYDQDSKDIRELLGMPENKSEIEQQKAVFHKPGSLQYHYAVEGPGHQIIVTDTRSWRSFPEGGDEHGEFLPPAQFDNQIMATDPLGNRALLVVLSTNAPPVPAIRSAGRHTIIAKIGAYLSGRDRSPDIFEAWEIPSVAFDRLMKTLTSKLPENDIQERWGRVILLSGDVHHSFATRLIYRAETRFEDTVTRPATAVIAQLVASSFKKETDSTRGFQRDGYTYAPLPAHLLGLIPPLAPEGYVGWNVAPGERLDVGWEKIAGSSHEVKIDFKGPTLALWRDRFPTNTFRLNRRPDYRYRLDYINPLRQGSEASEDDPVIPPLPTGATPDERKQAAQAYVIANARYRSDIKKPGKEKLIGVNNFSEVTFDWGVGDDKAVRHTLRWYAPHDEKFATTYLISLNPNDDNYPDIKDGSNP